MSIIETTKQLRDTFKNHYHIDHIIDLQLISAILLENDIRDSNHQDHICIAKTFAKHFNQRWNMQIISKQENRNKANAVLHFIQWKYEPNSISPNEFDFKTISEIYQHYCKNRKKCIFYLKSDPKWDLRRFEKIESSLFNLLKYTNNRHPFVAFKNIKNETDMLYQLMASQFSCDHKVELQIILSVLVANNIKDNVLITGFAKYFNEDWNFQIMERKENESKGTNVHNWLKFIHQESGRPNPNIFQIIKCISDYYEKHRHFVMKDIEKDNISKETKDIFLKIENDLHLLLLGN